MKITVYVGNEHVHVEGDDALFDKALVILRLWFAVISPKPSQQTDLDQLVARGAAANDSLRKVVAACTPTS